MALKYQSSLVNTNGVILKLLESSMDFQQHNFDIDLIFDCSPWLAFLLDQCSQ
jgi:hypothetical protein